MWFWILYSMWLLSDGDVLRGAQTGKKNNLRITVSYHFLVCPEDFSILDKGISETHRQQVYQCWRQEVRPPRTAVSLMTLGSERSFISLSSSFWVWKWVSLSSVIQHWNVMPQKSPLILVSFLKAMMIINSHCPMVEAIHRHFQLLSAGYDILHCNKFYQ